MLPQVGDSLQKLSTCHLQTSQVAHQAGAYPGFSSNKWQGVFLPPYIAGLPSSIKLVNTHLYT